MDMDSGRMRAAQAAEMRRLELDLPQNQLGVDPKTWRDFIAGRTWPQVRSRARIEAHLKWKIGALARIAGGESAPSREALEPDTSPGRSVPDEIKQLLALINEIDDHFRLRQHGLVRRKLRMVAEIVDELRARVPDETLNTNDMRIIALDAATQRGVIPPDSKEQPA